MKLIQQHTYLQCGQQPPWTLHVCTHRSINFALCACDVFVLTVIHLCSSYNMGSPNKSANDEPSLKEVLSAILSVKDDVNKFKNESTSNFTGLSEEIKNIKTQTTTLEHRFDIVEAKQLDITYELELIKQKQLSSNLCITGIKHQENENLKEIFSKICECLSVNCNDNIIGIYRTKGQFNTSIIVQLKNDNLKREILAAKKTKTSIIVDELQIRSLAGTGEININGHLTPYFSHILFVARQAVKREELLAAWFSNRGILIRAQNQESPILIKSVEGLAPYVTTTNPSKRKATDDIDNTNHPPKKTAESATNNPITQTARATRAGKPPNNKATKAQPVLRSTRANSTVTPPTTFNFGAND